MPALRTRLLAGTAAALAGGTVALTAPATASATPTPPQDAAHCTLDAGTGRTACFATFTGAVAEATGGRVLDAPADARAAAEDPALRARVQAATAGATTTDATGDGATGSRLLSAEVPPGQVIHGVFFEHPGYGGNSFTVHGGGLCDDEGGAADFTYTFPGDWWDRISSVQGWANCSIYLYSEPDQGGDRDGRFNGNVGDVGAFMNDRTRSTSFH